MANKNQHKGSVSSSFNLEADKMFTKCSKEMSWPLEETLDSIVLI